MHFSITNLQNIQKNLNSVVSENSIDSPKIIVVTKTFPIKTIIPLIEFGHRDFGENKIQEAVEKWSGVKSKYDNLKLHMLGKLQTNKVKYLIPLFDYIHSLDNLRLAEKIAKEEIKKNKKISIFIQVNIGSEVQKNGVEVDDLFSFYNECTANLSLNIIGLMCLPPRSKKADFYFLKLKKLAKNLNLKYLSMGMSEDYQVATKNGATHLRIGSKIFGNRD